MWTLLDTGLRVGEFSSLSRNNIDWQGHRLMIYGNGGPYGTKSKRRIIRDPKAATPKPSEIRRKAGIGSLISGAGGPFRNRVPAHGCFFG